MRKILLIIIFISLAIRIDFEITYADMYIDKRDQIGAAKSLINGHGLSYCYVSIKDISRIEGEFLNIWPPGYTLLLIPFYYVTGDFIRASNLIDVICIIFIYISIILLLRCLKISPRNQILLFVFFGLSYTPFYHFNSSDLVSLSIFQWAIYIGIYYLKNNTNLIGMSILMGVLLFLTSFIRYSYYPMIIAVPMIILLIGYFAKQKNTIKFGIISGFTGLLLIIIQTLIIKILSGNFYRSLDQEGLYWNNLLKFDVFPFKSFFFYEGYLTPIFKSHPFIEPVYIITASLLSILIIFEIFRVLIYKKGIESIKKYYLVLGLGVLTVNVVFLIYMSITHKGLKWEVPPWTFVEETRYYAQSMLYLEIIFLTFIFFEQYINKTLRFVYRFTIFFIFFISFIYWFNNNYNLYVKKQIQYTFKGMYSEELQMRKIINETLNNNNSSSVTRVNEFSIFTCFDPEISSFIYMSTSVDGILYDYQGLLKKGEINSSKPVTLFIAMPCDNNNIQALERYSPIEIAKLKSFILYEINFNLN